MVAVLVVASALSQPVAVVVPASALARPLAVVVRASALGELALALAERPARGLALASRLPRTLDMSRTTVPETYLTAGTSGEPAR